jgi:hypothetical protein
MGRNEHEIPSRNSAWLEWAWLASLRGWLGMAADGAFSNELLRQDQLAVAGEAKAVFRAVMQQNRFTSLAQEFGHRNPPDGENGFGPLAICFA